MHELYMRTALSLARRGAGKTSPNPMVGSVIVKEGRIIGKGYHSEAGKPHAEIEALAAAREEMRGSTLYVTLEPCCHHGRTPPCTDSVIKAGISEAVVAMEDPNPLVAGKGIRILEEAGIKVTLGVLEKQARELNEAYIKHITTGLPFVVLKAGMSLDGKIATSGGESRWITGEESRRYAHKLRAISDAVMVGIETVLKDDPHLTVRLNKVKGRDPIRVVVDSELRIRATSKLFSAISGTRIQVVVATTGRAQARKLRELEAMGGVKVLKLDGPHGRVDLGQLLKSLGDMGITCLLVEGGGEVIASMLRGGLADKVMFFISPIIIGGKASPGAVGGEGARLLAEAIRLSDVRVRRLREDVLIEGYIVKG